MRLISALAAISSSLFICLTCALASVPQTMDELREVCLKQLLHREPRASDYIEKLHSKIAALRHNMTVRGALDEEKAQHLELKLDEIIMSAGTLSEDRLRAAVDLLADLSGQEFVLTPSELNDVRVNYSKICALLDDQIFVKDLDDTLLLHDQFVQHVLWRLWEKRRIDRELKHLEQSVSKAAPIPYGRLELLRKLQDHKLAAPAVGCYIGTCESDGLLLSTYRPSVAILEESTGATLTLEAIQLDLVNKQGQLVDLDTANYRDVSVCPPVSLWIKCRLLEGRIPSVNFNLPDCVPDSLLAADLVAESSRSSLLQEAPTQYTIQAVLEGKLDDYFSKNLKLIASTGAATLVGLFGKFDHLACSSFGADGKTPYYLLTDQKLAMLPAHKQHEEIICRLRKGAFTKDTDSELRKYYGDPNVPDGPERVRDAWKHIRAIGTAAGAHCVSYYSDVGPFHGYKKALSEHPAAGVQEWNKLENYWSDSSALDWLAVSGAQLEAASGKTNIVPPLTEFISELRTSHWHSTPVILTGIAPAHKEPFSEIKWLGFCFQDLIPVRFPEVKACVLEFPGKLTLETPDALSAFRRAVASEKYYKQNSRLLPSAPGSQ